MMRISAALCLLLSASLLRAQTQPEIRRAEPVVPTAVPSAAGQVAAPEAVPAGEIRTMPAVATTDPLMAVFEQANGYYAQKMYDLAVAKYQEFLQLRSAGAERQASLFRMGESLRALNRNTEAMAAYQQLTKEYHTGDFLGPAAYRLGEMQYTAREYDGSIESFRLAGLHVRDAKLRVASKFFEGRALDAANRKLEALSAYRAVVAEPGDNPYRERAMFDLAESDARAGLTEGAYRQFRKLAETAKTPAVRAGGAVKAGLIAIDAKDYAAARPLLVQAEAERELAAWRTAAQNGLLRLDYEEQKYEDVADRAAKLLPELPREAQPEALLLAANARRQLGQQAEALALYDRLVAGYPDSSSAQEAGFHRLVSLVAQRDERAAAQIDAFLASSRDPAERARASLLMAELLFERKDYAGAEKFYASAANSSGTEKYRADALYKLAWCRLQQKNFDNAISTLTEFIGQYPRHPQMATAFMQRAMAQLQTGQREGALADFGVIIDKQRGAPEREDAMLQRALLFGNLERPAEMSAAFERLLAEYPETRSAAQAKFWIGYAAFEKKDYREALPGLAAARKLDPDKYGERATLRLLLAQYYLQDRVAAAAEARALAVEKSPKEVRLWLGAAALEAGDFAEAAEFLGPLANEQDADTGLRVSLARAQAGSGNHERARVTLETVLPLLHEPKETARAHLLLADSLIALQRGAEAKDHAEAALRLQPEGRINAEARVMNGRSLLAQDRFDDAARAFMAVALLYDEKDITPQALVLAEQAYRRAQNASDADRAHEELQRRYPDYKPPAQS
jgi:TolA-binding protein